MQLYYIKGLIAVGKPKKTFLTSKNSLFLLRKSQGASGIDQMSYVLVIENLHKVIIWSNDLNIFHQLFPKICFIIHVADVRLILFKVFMQYFKPINRKQLFHTFAQVMITLLKFYWRCQGTVCLWHVLQLYCLTILYQVNILFFLQIEDEPFFHSIAYIFVD